MLTEKQTDIQLERYSVENMYLRQMSATATINQVVRCLFSENSDNS